MPNALSATGLTTITAAEFDTIFTTAMQTIYGATINIASSTPDGQMIGNYKQQILDLADLLVQIYTSFDPDQAIGVALDQRCSINGIQRQAGTYTITPVTLVTSQTLNLYGLDQSAQPVFTVADNAGNQWQLITTQTGLAAGTHSFSFQASVPGAQLTIPGTITSPVTIVLGVTSINNPLTYSTLGVAEESDYLFRIRRQKSVSLASQGYLSALYAALQNVPLMSSAYVYENLTSTTNADGTPGHTIWCIVSGNATAANIAQAIYTKRSAGCGMRGNQSYNITQVDGSLFTVYWDNVITRNLYIAFTVTSINGSTAPNIAGILSQLPTLFVPNVYSEVNINDLATYIRQVDSNTLVTGAGFSEGDTQTFTLSGVPASGTFELVYNGIATAAINWNDSAATIQTKLQAVAGLSSATVSGSLASQSLVINTSLIGNVLSLLYVTANSLATSGSVAITFTANESYAPTLTPASKQNQFVVTALNIIILPMQMSQTATSVVHSTGTATFAGVGGYAAKYTYSMQSNPSGGSVNASTGVYAAGATNNVTDVVKVTDAFGNTATASISVT